MIFHASLPNTLQNAICRRRRVATSASILLATLLASLHRCGSRHFMASSLEFSSIYALRLFSLIIFLVSLQEFRSRQRLFGLYHFRLTNDDDTNAHLRRRREGQYRRRGTLGRFLIGYQFYFLIYYSLHFVYGAPRYGRFRRRDGHGVTISRLACHGFHFAQDQKSSRRFPHCFCPCTPIRRICACAQYAQCLFLFV